MMTLSYMYTSGLRTCLLSLSLLSVCQTEETLLPHVSLQQYQGSLTPQLLPSPLAASGLSALLLYCQSCLLSRRTYLGLSHKTNQNPPFIFE